MPLLNASFSVETNSTRQAHKVAYGAIVDLALLSASGAHIIQWSISATSHASMAVPTITLGGVPSGTTANFTMPSDPGDGEGRAVTVKCVVTDSSGNTAVDHRVVGVPNVRGAVPLCVDEALYRHGTHGWAAEINTLLALGGNVAAKRWVRAATTGNISLSGAQMIDGVSVVAGDRVLVKNQTTPSENGVYVAAAGAWTRAPDFTGQVTSGTQVFVSEGSSHRGSNWQLVTADPIVIGTTALVFQLMEVVPLTTSHTSSGAAYETVAALTYAVPDGWFVDVTFRATGRASAEYAHYERVARFTRLPGGAAAIDWDVAGQGSPKEVDINWDARINLNGNNLEFQVKANSDNPAWKLERIVVPQPLP